MIGRTIGSYEVVEKIGEGGMGAVYRAVDRMLDREVAIKAIRPELAREPEILERFRFEAKTLARVSHPAIATIYGFFQEGGELFLAMELVRGHSLSAVLRDNGALPWERAVALLAGALEGIERAHRLGIVHRDLKPDNLMIDESGALKVMDFGIARAVGSGRLTRTGLLVGTLRYIAPEQIRGEEVDQRTDIYALGVVLYEMIAGRVPFEGSNDFAILRAQIEDPPAPPSSIVPRLPEWLDHAVLRALAKEPADRFQTVEEMQQFLVSRGSQRTGAGIAPPPAPPGSLTATALLRSDETRPTGRPAAGAPTGAGGAASLDETADLRRSRPAAPPPPPPAPVSAATAASTPVQSSYRTVGSGSPGWKIAAAAAALVVILAGAGIAAWLSREAAGEGPEMASTETAPAAAGESGPASAPSGPVSAEPSPATASSGQTVPEPSALPRPAPENRESARRPAVVERPARSFPEPAPPPADPEPARPQEAPAVEPEPSEETPSAPAGNGLAVDELRQIGGGLPSETARLLEVYQAYLEKKEDSGQDLTEEDEQLVDELESLDEAAGKLNQAFKNGAFARFRRMGRSEEEQLRRRVARLAEQGQRVDSLIARVQPSADVQQSWREIRRRWKRVAELAGR